MDGPPRYPRDGRDDWPGPPRGPALGRERIHPRYGRDARDSPGPPSSSTMPHPSTTPSNSWGSSRPGPPRDRDRDRERDGYRERYRSPPPGLHLSTVRERQWSGPDHARPRERPSWGDRPLNGPSSGPRGMPPRDRDDYDRRPSWGRPDDDGWDRHHHRIPSGKSRPFIPDGSRRSSAGGFEIPFRNRISPRKRGRGDSSDEDEYRRVTSRPTSPGRSRQWNAGGGSTSQYQGRSGEDDRSRRPPSPQGASKAASVASRKDDAPVRSKGRSVSPGELSEGQIPPTSRSPSPSDSGTRTRDIPSVDDDRPQLLHMSGKLGPVSEQTSQTATPKATEDDRPAPSSSTPALSTPKTIPLVKDAVGATKASGQREVVPLLSDSESALPRTNVVTTESPAAPNTTEASSIRVEPTPAAETKVTVTLSQAQEPAITALVEGGNATLSAAETSSKPTKTTSFLLPPSPSTPPLPTNELVSATAETDAASDPQATANGKTNISPSSPLSSLPPTSPVVKNVDTLQSAAIPSLNGILLPPIDLLDQSKSVVEQSIVGDISMDVDDTAIATGASAGPDRDEDDSMDGTHRAPSPQESHSPPQPDSPPNHFKTVLEEVIASNTNDSGHADAIINDNRCRMEKARNKLEAKPRLLTKFPISRSDLALHSRMLPLLMRKFAAREQRRSEKMVELREAYKEFNADWTAHCRRLDQIKERILKRNQSSTVPQTPSIDGAGLPFYPEPVTPGPTVTSGRANRRSTASGAFGYGDAVRSEAEFLEILASLETADMRDPTVRATRTAAVVPDMIIDPIERRELVDFDDSRRKVEDPVGFYSIRAPLDLWTEDEVQMFCKRFAAYPKQFGKIAAALPDKTTAQCVLFYYRMKNTIDFRSLSDRRGLNGKRRKPKRKLLTMDNDKKGSSSLLSNLKRTQTDERDDDEGGGGADSPPPSPQATRKLLPSDNPQVFVPPDFSIRDTVDDRVNGVYEDDDSYFARPIKPGKTQRTPKTRDGVQLPSDNTMEAAAALGSLAGLDEREEDGASTPRTEATRKRKGESAGDDYTPRGSAGNVNAAATGGTGKRRTATSSYWSVAERTEIMRLLGVYGKDWAKIAQGIGNKTAIQCRNWYQNNVKKLKLDAIVKGRGRDGSESGGSVLPTPSEEYNVSSGTPLADATSNATNGPRAGFFVADQKARDERIVRAGMQIRNLLNEDAPVDDKSNPAGEDWFGAANDDAGSATTEDETEQQDVGALAADPAVAAPPPRPHSVPQRSDAYAGFEHDRRQVNDASSARKGYFTHHPSLSRLNAGLPTSQPLVSPLGSWQSSPAGSPSPAYSPFGLGPARLQPPHSQHFDRVASIYDHRPASAGAVPQASSATGGDYFNSKPPYARPFTHTSAYAPDVQSHPATRYESPRDRPWPPH
ncbi:DNA-binding protein snt1 [Microbotryomycetes sp. JL221]|nr:DNA-binding protein snt1 [Microbotryomycetes sp. JL221]